METQIPAYYTIRNEGALDRYPGWREFWAVDIGDQLGGYFPNESEAREWIARRERLIDCGALQCPWTAAAKAAVAA